MHSLFGGKRDTMKKVSCSTAEVAATVLMLTEKYTLQRRKKLLRAIL